MREAPSAKTFALPASAAAAGFKLVTFETVGSTNDVAFERARDGERRLWVVARAQTSGRGRHGRRWQSPPGNLYASMLLVDFAMPQAAPLLAFAAGVGLAHALRRLVPEASRVRVKWPNDILYDAAKLAGILLEGRVLPSGAYALVVGFGVNCRSRPADLPYRAAALADTGAPAHRPEDVLPLLAGEMARWLRVFEQGFDAIRSEWLTLAAAIGTPITVATAKGQFEGVFQTIDARGRLILAEADGSTHAIEAGDVVLGH